MKSKYFLPLLVFITFQSPEIDFKTYFSIDFHIIFVGYVLHASFCAATGFSRGFDEETSCILYFFGLGKNTKKSLLESPFSSFLTL